MIRKLYHNLYLRLLLAVACLGGFIYWMFSTADRNVEAWEQRGLKTYAIVTKAGFNNAYFQYSVQGTQYDYVKTITRPNETEATRLQLGDTLEVTYLPEDPGNAWISLKSWEKYRNR
jgi:hypothetical protein